MSNSNMSDNHIDQATFSVVNYSIATLRDMPVTVHGEQAPLNLKSVAKISDSLIDSPLLEPLKVCILNESPILSGGRHRLASLLETYADNLDLNVTVLEYICSSADEVLDHVLGSNGSRSVKAGEKNALNTASKLGFGTVTIESLVASIDTAAIRVIGSGELNLTATRAERVSLFVSALAMLLVDTFGVSDTGGLVIAQSLVVALKKVNSITVEPAKVDADGTQLSKESTHKALFLDHVLTMGTDAVTEFLLLIPDAITIIRNVEQWVPMAQYIQAHATGLDMVNPSAVSVNNLFSTTITPPTAWQREAVKYTRVAIKPIVAYISEQLNVELK